MAYEGQLIELEDDDYFEDGYEPCEFCAKHVCVCGEAGNCRCGAYIAGPDGGFCQIADCYC